MKTKLLLFVMAVAIGFTCFTSCKPKGEITDTCNNLAAENFAKTAIRSGSVLNDGILTIIDYKLVLAEGSAKPNQIVRQVMKYGDGLKCVTEPQTFSFEQKEVVEKGTGIYYLFTPIESTAGITDPLMKTEPYKVIYFSNSIIEEGVTAAAGVSKIDVLENVDTLFANSRWNFAKKEYWKDTTYRDSLQYTIVVKKDPVTGKKYADTVRIDTLHIIDIKEAGLKADTSVTMTFSRDPITLINTGHMSIFGATFTRDSLPLSVTVLEDDFTWVITEIINAKKFNVELLKKGATEPEVLPISKFTVKDGEGSLTVDRTDFVMIPKDEK